jgi:hypothetical protein
MDRLERCEYAIEKGYTYNPETGEVYNRFGSELKNKKEDYLTISLIKNKKQYQLFQHQFGWYFINKEIVDCIDHINKDRSDNRIINLRSITKQQNHFNSNAKGYSWDKNRNKWMGYIHIDNKKIHLGSYDTEEEASNAYQEAKKTYHII